MAYLMKLFLQVYLRHAFEQMSTSSLKQLKLQLGPLHIPHLSKLWTHIE